MTDIINQLRQASLSKEDYRWEAADLIQSLREKTQYWPDNAERDAVIRHQKEEIERLREWNREIALNAREFVAENQRLRAVLHDINMTTRCDKTAAKARAAIGFTPVPDGQTAPPQEEA